MYLLKIISQTFITSKFNKSNYIRSPNSIFCIFFYADTIGNNN